VGDVISTAEGVTTDLTHALRGLAGDDLGTAINHIVNPLLDKIPGTSTGIGELIKQDFISVEKELVSWVEGSTAQSASSGGYAGAGSGNIRSDITSILKTLGLSPNLLTNWMTQVQTESGGNSRAVNNWDINAKNGTPSVGLVQVIGPTFDAYAGPYKNVGPFLDGVSVNDMANLYAGINYAKCLPLDSEILTRDGWKRYDEVCVGDETVGYDAETGTSVWTKVTAVHYYEDAEITEISSPHLALRSTPGHRWITNKYIPNPNGNYRISGMTETKDLGSRHSLVLSADLASDSSLPITDEEAELLGWIASDGCVSHLKSKDRVNSKLSVTIHQAKSQFVKKIRDLLDKNGEYSEYTRTPPDTEWGDLTLHTFRLKTKYAASLLARSRFHKQDKHAMERMVLAMSDSQRTHYLQGLLDGDGSANQEGSRVFYQKNGAVLDSFLLAASLSGYFIRRSDKNRGEYSSVVMRNTSPGCVYFRGSKPAGREPVWCVTTEAGTWTARQQGQIFLTGNSAYGADMAAVIGHGHGYADGTLGAQRGWHWVGERGPELAYFHGGEKVYSHEQSMAAIQAMPGIGGYYAGTNPNMTSEDISQSSVASMREALMPLSNQLGTLIKATKNVGGDTASALNSTGRVSGSRSAFNTKGY
jgi:SLT domain-containing protein